MRRQPKSRPVITLEEARVLQVVRRLRTHLHLSIRGDVTWDPPCPAKPTTRRILVKLLDDGCIREEPCFGGALYLLTPLGEAMADQGPTLRPTRVMAQSGQPSAISHQPRPNTTP